MISKRSLNNQMQKNSKFFDFILKYHLKLRGDFKTKYIILLLMENDENLNIEFDNLNLDGQ